VFDKENNNDANGNVRDCLAESETPSTSATMGAGHAEFSIGSLLASGIDFHRSGIVLGHDIQLGNTSRWSSRLVRVGGAQKTASRGSPLISTRQVRKVNPLNIACSGITHFAVVNVEEWTLAHGSSFC
jgi:hypothetical protein